MLRSLRHVVAHYLLDLPNLQLEMWLIIPGVSHVPSETLAEMLTRIATGEQWSTG